MKIAVAIQENRMRLAAGIVSLCMAGTAYVGLAQSGAPAPGQQPNPQSDSKPDSKYSPQDENPFPGVPEQPAAAQSPSQPGQSKPAKPPADDGNPFPGDLPGRSGIPTDTIPPSAEPGAAANGAAPRAIDPDGDPMRSPDGSANTVQGADDGFSSSRAGLSHLAVEDDTDARPGNSLKNKTREQTIKEDLDVGSFYLNLKNWKGAQMRFSAAFALDSENPDAVWGLAETERHMNQTKEAMEHFKLLLSYDPDGPHSRDARKALDQLESMPQSRTGSTASPIAPQ